MVIFSPNDIKFKNPAGAVKINEKIHYRIKFSRPSNPEDVFLCLTKDGENEVRYPLRYKSGGVADYFEYEGDITVTSAGLYFYHFKIFTNSEIIRVGCDEFLNAMYNKGQDWQLTVTDKKYEDPKWLSGGVMYQIFPDRFCIGGERLKTKTGVVYRNDWGGVPQYRPQDGKILNNDFFGGNIKGITKKLGYLKSLGVNCIYLNPIFEAHSNHKYDTGNYRKIDSDFGNLYDFEELIKKADKKSIKIILDGVFSHTGDDSIYFNKYGRYDSVGAYQSKDSPFYDWYTFKDFENKDYVSWWNIDILPNTVEENIRFDEFINGEDGIIKYWTEKGIGGWRLDVVDELPDKFLDRLVKTTKKVKPDAAVLGEVWEDASNKTSYSLRRRYLQGSQLDSVTNYPFKEDILNYIRTGDAVRLYKTINVFINNYPKEILNNVMNILSTHDTARLLTVLGENGKTETREQRAKAKVRNFDEAVALLKMATLLQFTLMGVPCIFYGDEAGLEGYEDPFNRRCFPWDNKNNAILRWHKKLGALRNSEKQIFAQGEFIPVTYENGIFAFARRIEGDEVIVIVNNSGEAYNFDTHDKEYTDLISFLPFKGKVENRSGVAIKLTNRVNFLKEKLKK